MPDPTDRDTALIVLAVLPNAAMAEETTVVRRGSAPSVAVERRDITTGSVGCGSKTGHEEGCD